MWYHPVLRGRFLLFAVKFFCIFWLEKQMSLKLKLIDLLFLLQLSPFYYNPYGAVDKAIRFKITFVSLKKILVVFFLPTKNNGNNFVPFPYFFN